MQRIMVATDGSDGADRAIDVGSRIAAATGSELILLNVADALSGDEMRQLARAERDVSDALETLSTQLLLRAKARAQSAGAPKISLQTAWGDPAEAIIEVAGREQIDAVVVGRRGRGRLTGLLLGSVSQKIASLAPCTVIVAP